MTQHLPSAPFNPISNDRSEPRGRMRHGSSRIESSARDVYFSADVETDGPIPGPFSMLSVGIVVAGVFDGKSFTRPSDFENGFYAELKPISNEFQAEALAVNKLDRDRLITDGEEPQHAMTRACDWIRNIAAGGKPVLVAYPLSFDWMWLFWYFTRFSAQGSPFSYSSCYDLKTAYSVKAKVPISEAGRSRVPASLKGNHPHTHHALDDAIEQAELFANIFEWNGQ